MSEPQANIEAKEKESDRHRKCCINGNLRHPGLRRSVFEIIIIPSRRDPQRGLSGIEATDVSSWVRSHDVWQKHGLLDEIK